MRVNTSRLVFDVPINHDTRPAVTGMPFGHQVLIPGAEFLGIRCAGCSGFPPHFGQPFLQNGIHNLDIGRLQVFGMDKLSLDVEQIFIQVQRFDNGLILGVV